MTSIENKSTKPLLLVFAGSRGFVIYSRIPGMEVLKDGIPFERNRTSTISQS